MKISYNILMVSFVYEKSSCFVTGVNRESKLVVDIHQMMEDTRLLNCTRSMQNSDSSEMPLHDYFRGDKSVKYEKNPIKFNHMFQTVYSITFIVRYNFLSCSFPIGYSLTILYFVGIPTVNSDQNVCFYNQNLITSGKTWWYIRVACGVIFWD